MNGIKTKFSLPNLSKVFNKSATIESNSMENSSNTFNNSSELTSSRLTIPKLDGISKNVAIPKIDTTKFFVPKLNMNKSSSSPTLGSSNECLTPHEMSLKKIMDLRKLNISDPAKENVDANVLTTVVASDSPLTNSTNFVVDLTAALLTENDTINKPVTIIPEQFELKFIDCDVKLVENPISFPIITHNCEIDISHILQEKLTNRTKRTTEFGKILCSRFRCKNPPYVKHEFLPKHKIVPFKFDDNLKFRKIILKKQEV